MNASFQVVYLPLGLLLFLRRSNDRMALFCSFTLITFGGANTFYDFGSGAIDPTLAHNLILRLLALVLFGREKHPCRLLLSLSVRALCAALDTLGRAGCRSILAGSDLLSNNALQCRRTGNLLHSRCP